MHHAGRGPASRKGGGELLKRLLITATLLCVAVVLVIVAGTAAPVSQAHGLTYAGLKPIQKAHVSGALAGALGLPSTAARAAAEPACTNPPSGGDEGDEGDDLCPPDNFGTPAGPGAGNGDPNYDPAGN